jgi:hypothetical protein
MQGRPQDFIAELDVSFLLAGEDAPMKGYCVLLLKRHAIELYELVPNEGNAFRRDMQRASKAVHKVTAAVKLNYEIHGTRFRTCTCIYSPLYVGDVFENQPINPRIVKTPVYAEGEFAEFAERLRSSVSRHGVDVDKLDLPKKYGRQQ